MRETKAQLAYKDTSSTVGLQLIAVAIETVGDRYGVGLPSCELLQNKEGVKRRSVKYWSKYQLDGIDFVELVPAGGKAKRNAAS